MWSATCSAPDRRCTSSRSTREGRRQGCWRRWTAVTRCSARSRPTPPSLGLVTFQNAARIGGSACQTLARFTTGDTALIEWSGRRRPRLVLASDMNNRWNDFPLHATFVPFVHEVVRYLASAHAHAVDYLIGDAPAGVRRAPGIVTLNGRGAGGRRRAHDRRQRRSARNGSGAAVGGRVSVRGDAVEGCGRRRNARRGPGAGRSAAALALCARGDGAAAGGRRRARREDGLTNSEFRILNSELRSE